MVVYAPLMQLPAACSISVDPYLAGLCNQLNALQLNVPRYTQIATPAPLPPVLTQSAMLPCSPPRCNVQLPPTPPDSPQATSPPSPCNGVTLVPCTKTTLVPITNGITPSVVPFPPKVPNISSSPTSPCNTTAICNSGLCYQPRLLCAPGVCPITPTTLEVIPSTSMVSSTPAIITPPPSLSSSLCASSISAWKQSYGMEQVWQYEFKSLFTQYSPHNWMLFPVIDKPEGMWHTNVDSAKVRFCCEDCGHGWTSMKGRVAFWFVQNISTGEGVVCLKLYGQQCDRCKSGNYESAMWYPEEVLKVLVNIYNRVGQVYYGFQQAPYHRARRAGKPRTPHNSDLCQACKDGVCSERR